MAGAPEERHDQGDLVGEHGARLHHLAAVLTGTTDGATRLTARTLAAAGPGAGWRELRAALVRAHLRTAPRRTERMLPGGVRDAGDVLERLRPRERAVAALRLVEGASTADTAEALRLPADKVARLLPTTPGLGTALQAVGDRYALHGSDLAAALEPAVAQAPSEPPGGDRRRWWWVAAAVVPVALLVGYALSVDRDEPAGPDEAAPSGPGVVQVGAVDLGEAGFELDEDGEPPRGAAGLTRMETLELTPGGSADLALNTVDARFGGQVASFAVLWCDMPPADDPALDSPVGEITVEGSTLTLPCAGTAGEPAVGLDHLVALPASGEAEVRVTGDLPPDGGAVLGVYAQTDDMAVEPFPDGDLTAGPPVPEDAVVVDEAGAVMPFDPGDRLVQPVELSPTSTIRVWSGRTGAVSVLVDGIPVTDDGDLEWWATGEADWREQQPDIREGRWMVYVPGSTREFTIPDDVVPPNGRRPAVVEVVTESTEHVQVVATQAVPGEAAREPVPQGDGGEAPELISGHRLLGAWELPMDGLERELLDPPDGAGVAWALLGAAPGEGRGPLAFFGGGILHAGQTVMPVWPTQDPSEVSFTFQESFTGWFETSNGRLTEADQPPAGVPLLASAQASPGHPSSWLLAYEQVPYEEFDFAAAQVPATSWPVGEEPAQRLLGSTSPIATVAGDDLDEDGRTTVEVPTGVLGARITTEGPGRIRFQVDGEPVELLDGTDGWWSSWTDRDVVSETQLSYGAYSITGDLELTITVEDYEDVRIELLRS
ncbi:hypothetical protein AVL62_04570 [Serinicoccus chungangensis]|uniref:Uncharacterized protein n=1 Tax=Serinicoccus chungangensis TaxID=767452 RepID=A0A0W8I873_9MICO|nr:hypothetical protein [Serinicoccus chungangensis]KUG55595.1 hypothetical protein AVL62_04570 [Serinicoccus chungangensis]